MKTALTACLAAAAVLSVPTALAQTSVKSSSLAGVALQAGAIRIDDKTASQEFLDGLRQYVNAMNYQCGTAEMIMWGGQGHSAAKNKQLVAAVNANLKKAGYSQLDLPGNDSSDGVDVSFFTAATASKTLIGTWAASSDFLGLGWCAASKATASKPAAPKPTAPTASKPAPPAAPAASKPAAPAKPATVAPQPGYFAGRVTDASGKPIANANISIWGTTDAGQSASFDALSDAGGNYKQRVPNGVYGAKAAASISYLGRQYRMPLHPTDNLAPNSTGFDSKAGAVRNFVLRTSGLKPYPNLSPTDLGSYYGGGIVLGDENAYLLAATNALGGTRFPDGSIVEVTLVPQGPLLDGSAGKTITFRKQFPIQTLQDRYLLDVPLGRYLATARITEPDGSVKPLRVVAYPDASSDSPYRTKSIPQPAASAVVDFAPRTDPLFDGTFPVVLDVMY